ncbi:FMN-binding protein [Demequina oxidasica]|uniref:FMN-binding protein n=1 Tax=Demequina oxidasica TaxID=676199 RepID=UPI000A43582F|nr:FMN-binding protein [Demequina oxidasica]
MRTSRKLMVGGASVVILGAGFAAAPEAAVLELADPGADSPSGVTPPPAPTPTAVPDEMPVPEASTTPDVSAGATDGTYPGPVVSNIRGDYQLQIVVADGVVTDVEFLAAGTEAAESVSINAMALPVLREEILEAQDWDVDYVSGASFTSPAMVESAHGAFDDAGL